MPCIMILGMLVRNNIIINGRVVGPAVSTLISSFHTNLRRIG
jgi:hypothetical protein